LLPSEPLTQALPKAWPRACVACPTLEDIKNKD